MHEILIAPQVAFWAAVVLFSIRDRVRKVGGLRFVRLGRLNISYSIARRV